MASDNWRVFCTRMNGDGTETVLHPDLPVSSCSITDPLSSASEVSITLSPEVISPSLFIPWSTAIYAECDKDVRVGGIVPNDGITAANSSITVTGTGFSDYPSGQPWTDATKSYINTDPGKILSTIWSVLQAHAGGDLGLEVPNIDTGVTVGTPKKGKTAAQPFRLAYYETTDIGSSISSLLSEGSIEYREVHYWDGETLRHKLVMASPRLGSRLNHRMVIGENVTVIPDVEPALYASEVLVLGAGEGTKKIHYHAQNSKLTRLRRAYAWSESTITRDSAAKTRGERVLSLVGGTEDDISEITVTDSSTAPIGALSPGDEILVTGNAGYGGEVGVWLRILTRTYDPITTPNKVKLETARADKVG